MLEVLVPDFGDDAQEVTINNWYFEEGDTVEAGENLVEVTTGSGTFYIAAPSSGILAEVFFEEGDDVEAGEVVATIDKD